MNTTDLAANIMACSIASLKFLLQSYMYNVSLTPSLSASTITVPTLAMMSNVTSLGPIRPVRCGVPSVWGAKMECIKSQIKYSTMLTIWVDSLRDLQPV